MRPLLSGGSSQKLLHAIFFAMMCLFLAYAAHLLYFSGSTTAAAIPSSYHNNAGVLQYVNPKIGTYGITPNGNGGMIPSVGMPFGMTRWTPQTREV